MLVLTGLPGSGKSAFVLDRLRAAARAGRPDVRLLVPTATMAEHLRHQQARAGLVFRPELIQTFSKFASSLITDVRLVSRPLFHLMVDEALRQVAPGEFAGVIDAPGFAASAAQALEMLDTAGCGRAALSGLRAEAPAAPALALVWRHVEEQMAARGLVTRAGLLRRAAEQVRAGAAGQLREIWFDGFTAFTDPELGLVEALSATREVVVTLPLDASSLSTRRRFAQLHAEVRELPAPAPRQADWVRFAADSLEREADEIARRILASGHAFREIGLVLRNPDRYAGLLESTFERFGIPARFYFTAELHRNSAAAYLIATVDAMLSGWEFGQCLTALRLAPGNANSAAMDRLDFAVRKGLPGRGLPELRATAHPDSQKRIPEAWDVLDRWRGKKLRASDWARELGTLRRLFTPGRTTGTEPWSRVQMFRSQSAALDLFESAMQESSEWWKGSSELLPLDEFWRAAKTILRLTPLRIADARSNVVHVMSVYEARQWDLSTIFLCGLAEREFPRRNPQNPFVSDVAMRRLQREGVRVSSSEDRDAEEHSLFEAVAANAGTELVLSYAREEQNLPSVFWQTPEAREEPAVPVLPEQKPRRAAPPSAIVSADLFPVLQQRSAALGVTALENYLQCSFKFLARNILDLKPAPPRPEDRLDALQQGILVHQVLSAWYPARAPIGPLFDESFTRKCEDLRISIGYRTEVLRRQMRAALSRFADDQSWPRGNPAELEVNIEINLGEGTIARGRIDRLETFPDGSLVIVDYKYSNATNTKKKVDDETLLQGPLYVAGVQGERPIAAMVYYNVRTDPNKQEPKPFGWGAVPGTELKLHPLDAAWTENGVAAARAAIASFRSGRILPRPKDSDQCDFCDFRDTCRWEFTAAMHAAAS